MTYLIGIVPIITVYIIVAHEIMYKNPAFQIHAQFFMLLSIPLWIIVFTVKDIQESLKEIRDKKTSQAQKEEHLDRE